MSNRGKLARLRAETLRQEKLNREAKRLVMSWENEKLRKDLDSENDRLIQLQKTIDDNCRQASSTVTHNFEVDHPPPFRCYKPNCSATFVDVKHLARHSSCGKKHMGTLQSVLQERFGCKMVEEEIGEKGGDEVINLDIRLWLALQQLRVCFVGSLGYNDASFTVIGYIKDLANKMVVVPVYKTTTSGYIDPSSLMSLHWWTLQQILNHYNACDEGGGFKRSEGYQRFKNDLRNRRSEDINKARDKVLSEAFQVRILEARALKVELQNLKTYQMESDLATEACNNQLMLTCEAIFADVTAYATVKYVAERKAITSVVNGIFKELVQKAAYELAILKRDIPGKAVNGIIDASVALTRSREADILVWQETSLHEISNCMRFTYFLYYLLTQIKEAIRTLVSEYSCKLAGWVLTCRWHTCEFSQYPFV